VPSPARRSARHTYKLSARISACSYRSARRFANVAARCHLHFQLFADLHNRLCIFEK